ncbi:tRNA pseudouridine synthase-like 1 isoform X8 [Mastomys coucha]|uniref:tRNA pseudouridine synthase-like 1 isoform X8 n=1 Tax=Mastomys coucha TaxID=35658 RepID=UPI001261EBA1|nr:tRNA pseudouridine synthase-like 1 isoform X8 [Mastomys coucha]
MVKLRELTKTTFGSTRLENCRQTLSRTAARRSGVNELRTLVRKQPSSRPCEAEDSKHSRVQKTALRIRSLNLVPPPFLHSGGGVAAVRGNQRAVGVLNFLEEAAKRLNSVDPVRFTISSRTDTGVHALSNAAHLDIQRRPGQQPFSPEVVTKALNTHLKHPAIRVLKAFRVPDDFHARHAATSRTYLYRLATGCSWPNQLPVFEQNVCWALPTEYLNIEAMQEAAQHLLGTHDFSAFQSAGSPVTNAVRTLRRVSVSPGPASPFVLPQESRRLQFWTLEFESQSFLYRQDLVTEEWPASPDWWSCLQAG